MTVTDQEPERVKIDQDDPRYCPQWLHDEPHDAHEFHYEYERSDGLTRGNYYCQGVSDA